jgi:hypothetical protein
MTRIWCLAISPVYHWMILSFFIRYIASSVAQLTFA